MKKQLLTLSLLLGLPSFLQAINVQLVNSTDKVLPIRIKTYHGTRRARELAATKGELAALLDSIKDPEAAAKASIFGTNFDRSILSSEAFVLPNLLVHEEIYLPGAMGFLGYSNTVPLQEAKEKINEKKIYRVIIGLSPFNTYTYQTSIVDPNKELNQVSPDDLKDFDEMLGYNSTSTFTPITSSYDSKTINSWLQK